MRLLVLCLSAALLPSVWASSVAYMPGVTEEMTDPAFWSGMAEDPNALLSTPEEIARINATALANEGSNMHDLRNLPDRFDGAARCASLAEGGQPYLPSLEVSGAGGTQPPAGASLVS